MTGSWEDSYPYNANSSFALHPQYINLEAAGLETDEEFLSLKKELCSLDKIDYERVNSLKRSYLKKLFEATWASVSRRKSYKAFIDANKDWLSMDAGLCREGDPADERINIPSICPYNWRYRMHISLEQLLAADSFNATVSAMISEASRR